MVHLNWNEVNFWKDAAATLIVVWKVVKAAPRVLAHLLVPVLKFIATTTGSFVIKEYLYDHYPSRARKNRRSSSD